MKRPVTPASSLLLFLGTLACCLHGHPARAAEDLRLSPGRVVFTMKTNGEWTGFGVRGEQPLLAHGGIVVYSSHPGTTLLDERAASTHGAMRAINATGQTLFEGMRGGARTPGLQPDDDNDGRVDEDPWDRIDNDNDGQTDEDFAAIGDEMLVAIYASKGISVRQESFAWSLPHIDGMVASSIVVTNTGTKPVLHARIGIELEAGAGLDLGSAPTIDDNSRGATAFVERQVVFDDHNRGLAVLFMVPRAGLSTGATSAVSWDVRGDRDRVTVISPDLGDLAPGAGATIEVALVALPSDDLKAVRAMRSAHRTVVGDGVTRFIPPPVSLTRGGDAPASGPDAGVSNQGFDDPFWNTAGKLQETLLVGSPNPFRDAITIEYQIPSRVTDEDGLEHELPAAGERASVKVYNVAGRLVATLVDQPHSAGSYRTGWTARNTDGTAVASGVYYVRLQIGKRSVTMRMVQLR